MNTQSDFMPAQQKQLWIGMVEVRALDGQSQIILGDSKGAFVNVVTWASDAEQYRHNVNLVIDKLGGLFVSEVVNPEPVEIRRARIGGQLSEDVEDMVSRAEGNPNAIIYGTFHLFATDDA
jgi:hypothetical protein